MGHAKGPSEDDVQEWLQRMDGRIGDIFGLWTQGKRDDAWVAERLIAEGHIAALLSATTDEAFAAVRRWVENVNGASVQLSDGEYISREDILTALDEMKHRL